MQAMIDHRQRQNGKTYDMMSEIHEHIVNGSRQSILVVLGDMREVQFFADQWALRFPRLPRPDYVNLHNTLRIRGRQYEHVYVENVDLLDDGIYDERLQTITVGIPPGGTITFTSSPNLWSEQSHRKVVTTNDIIRRYRKRGN